LKITLRYKLVMLLTKNYPNERPRQILLATIIVIQKVKLEKSRP